MLGYIRPAAAELRVREHEFYKAAYCGLCRSMGKCTGQLSRMTLSYDFVFLVLVRYALTGERALMKNGRCMAHPLKRKPYLVHSEQLAYAASAAAVLMSGKISDDIADERGIRRVASRIIAPLARSAARRGGLSDLGETVAAELRALAELERAESDDIDAAADTFGRLLGAVMSSGLEGANKRIAYEMGRYTGRFIYIIDAVDDMAKDMEKGRYNPFLKAYGSDILEEREVCDFSGRKTMRKVPKKEIAESILCAAKLDLAGLERAENLVEYGDSQTMGMIRGIIGNIIGIGMPGEMMRVLGLFQSRE